MSDNDRNNLQLEKRVQSLEMRILKLEEEWNMGTNPEVDGEDHAKFDGWTLKQNQFQYKSDIKCTKKKLIYAIELANKTPNCVAVSYNLKTQTAWLHSDINNIHDSSNKRSKKHEWHNLYIKQ